MDNIFDSQDAMDQAMLNEQLVHLQAKYDRKCAHRRRMLAYHDECPDGDRRKYEIEQKLRVISNEILKVEEEMGMIVDELEAK
jgi:hypothetical protein